MAQFFSSFLTGNQEVPNPVSSNATGTSQLSVSKTGDSIEYSLTISGLDFGAFIGDGEAQTKDPNDDVTKVHIHNNVRGENGDLALGLIDLVSPEFDNQDPDDLQIAANSDGSTTLTGVIEASDPTVLTFADIVDDFRTVSPGEEAPFYWNIHTVEFPSGEIRGQIAANQIEVADPVFLVSSLSSDQEVIPTKSSATGTSELTLNETGDAVEYSLTISGIDFGAFVGDGTPQTADPSDDITKVHIHNDVRGENGDLAFGLIDLETAEFDQQDSDDLIIKINADGSTTLTGIWEESDPASIDLSNFVNELRTTVAGDDVALYWNIHTVGFPPGEIRGQLQIAANEINGSNRKDEIKGTEGSDIIKGFNGNDVVEGLAGNDTLLGNLGADLLVGGDGNDRLLGGNGNDTLTGGDGEDIFALETKPGRDVITDYQLGSDRLSLGNNSFDDLTIVRDGDNTRIRNGNNTLAVLSDIDVTEISMDDFVL